jgi:hypothetical protein
MAGRVAERARLASLMPIGRYFGRCLGGLGSVRRRSLRHAGCGRPLVPQASRPAAAPERRAAAHPYGNGSRCASSAFGGLATTTAACGGSPQGTHLLLTTSSGGANTNSTKGGSSGRSSNAIGGTSPVGGSSASGAGRKAAQTMAPRATPLSERRPMKFYRYSKDGTITLMSSAQLRAHQPPAGSRSAAQANPLHARRSHQFLDGDWPYQDCG